MGYEKYPMPGMSLKEVLRISPFEDDLTVLLDSGFRRVYEILLDISNQLQDVLEMKNITEIPKANNFSQMAPMIKNTFMQKGHKVFYEQEIQYEIIEKFSYIPSPFIEFFDFISLNFNKKNIVTQLKTLAKIVAGMYSKFFNNKELREACDNAFGPRSSEGKLILAKIRIYYEDQLVKREKIDKWFEKQMF